MKFFETERRMHAFEIAFNLDIDSYNALVCVGGDGTIHEMANGLLMRPDKKKIPLAFIPNGSGNDLCGQFNLDKPKEALSDLIKGDLIKIDSIKALVDHEDERDIPDEHKYQKHRYIMINSSFCMPA
jgi:diacylglycerol kinase family enzyme